MAKEDILEIEEKNEDYGNEFDLDMAMEELNSKGFANNLDKYVELIGYLKWYPDIFYDIIKPKRGGMTIHLDQRVFMRVACRFLSVYGVAPRSFGKTFLELMCYFFVAIFYPNVELSITAQTKENASKMLKDKFEDITRKYPLLLNEVASKKFSKTEAEVIFKSGGRITSLANAQSSKGLRRHRLNIEESALLNRALFEDALEPIPADPRRTIGTASVEDPEELNRQINFFTTSGYRASHEFTRCKNMIKEMAELKQGTFVYGADWMQSAYYGRGSDKRDILRKKKSMSSVYFDMNYRSRWVGATDGALVDLDQLMFLQNEKLEYEATGDGLHDYVIGFDVARHDESVDKSKKTKNASSAFVVGKIFKKANGRIDKVKAINMGVVDGRLEFEQQAIILKKLRNDYDAKIVVVDSNGLGVGLVGELRKTQYEGSEVYHPWKTLNTDSQTETPNEALPCLFDLKATGINGDIIATFIGAVKDKKLELLPAMNQNMNIDLDFCAEEELPHINTKFFIDEVSNLRLVTTGRTLSVAPVVTGLAKDRYSAVAYMLWYILTFEDYIEEEVDEADYFTSYLQFA